MDKLKEKISNIRLEADAASARADAAELALKQINEQQIEREQEIISLQNRITLLEDELDRKESRIAEAKQLAEDHESTRDASDVLNKRIHLLEEKLETAELELQQTKEKNMDVKTESLERTIAQFENERVDSEARYEALNEKYLKSKADLEETMKFLEDIVNMLKSYPFTKLSSISPCRTPLPSSFSRFRLHQTIYVRSFHSTKSFSLSEHIQNSDPILNPNQAKSSNLTKDSTTTQARKSVLLSSSNSALKSLNPTINQILSTKLPGDQVSVYGWVKYYRKQKNVAFLKIHDGSNFAGLQAVFDLSTIDPLPAESFEHLRPRLDLFTAISRIRNQLIQNIHSFYSKNDFIQINTPILTANDCEGGSSTFHLHNTPKDFYGPGKTVHLTVSGQLHLEAAALANNRVYTLSPCFRAELGLTSRHLAEFWMLEAELCFVDSVSQLMDIIEESVRDPISSLIKQLPNELAYCLNHKHSLKNQANNSPNTTNSTKNKSSTYFPIQPCNFDIIDFFSDSGSPPKPFARISYTDAIKVLQNSDFNFQFKPIYGNQLQTEHELYLSNIHFNATPTFVYDYPKQIKPFYMKSNKIILDSTNSSPPSNQNNTDKFPVNNNISSCDYQLETVGCVDLLMPNFAELAGGSLREDNYNILHQNIKDMIKAENTQNSSVSSDHNDINEIESSLQWYLDLRKYGSAPHAGFGVGFDRLVQLVTNTRNIRDVVLFPRYFNHCSV
ncbi:putative asparagine-tRNA ligase, mitochondrial [Smittium culicis]|uniref:Putative asparagine-tRNA ligase, mitochondrial n=1 Tax=Smittium culicis TaxID=133412 RepID=A0A1R1Y9Z3_9FUNG|nr:putative asparagine-tRNA ligase, mitochondrial [Smittium culicis]